MNENKSEKIGEREKYGIISGTAGIFLNILLFSGKFVAGIFLGSVSVTADALNNLSDVASSLVTLIGFKISAKKADDEHPFGHGRMEYIAGLIVSFLIILVGVELFKSSVESMINPSPLEKSNLALIVLSVSILVKLSMFVFNLRLSKKINSAALKATAKDSISDVLSTSIVLFAVCFSIFRPESKIAFDGIAGILVSVFIIINGIGSAKDTINPLLGIPADKKTAKEIENLVLSFDSIIGVHDLLIHEYGPGKIMISLHAEVPGDKNVFELHEIIDEAEKAVSEKFSCSATIHIDPVDLSDNEVRRLKEHLEKSAKEIDENLSVHDVRIIKCKNNETKICFDALRPCGLKMKDSEIEKRLSEKAKEFNPNCKCEIKIDNAFC